MYKIAILGCENSHANAFLRLIKEGKYPELQVLGIYSNEPEAAKKLADAFDVAVMDSYDSLVGKVDGVMITARHGDNHFKYAAPYFADGIPMFIDKPITCDEQEAVTFMRKAREKGIRFCGGSTCAALEETLSLAETVATRACGEIRGGSVVSPIYSDSMYGGFYFYAQHLIDIMSKIFGEGVQEILADKREGSVTFTARYATFNVLGTYVEKTGYYSASVYGSKSVQAEILRLNNDSFAHEMNDMMDLLQGKPMEKSYESFIYPVFVMNTILRSLASGKWEPMPEIKI